MIKEKPRWPIMAPVERPFNQWVLEHSYKSKRDEILVDKLLEDLKSKSLDEVLETIRKRGF